MNDIVYGIERWDKIRKEWMPCRFDLYDLEEVEETVNLLAEALPDTEFKPAQYTISEFQHIKTFE